MTPDRFEQLRLKIAALRIAVVGDFCLDRYLEIDPGRTETSIETGLPVHNVTRVRAQPGAAGTIVNNLAALGVRSIVPVGFCGDDGEGFELRRALTRVPGVQMEHFLTAPDRRTFTYCKPLLVEPGAPPRELSRLDSKNWTPTPPGTVLHLTNSVNALRRTVDAMVWMDQVDVPETGVIGSALRDVLRDAPDGWPPMLADSRRGLRDFPSAHFKMNRTELEKIEGAQLKSVESVADAATRLARTHGRRVFVSLSEEGILGAAPDGTAFRVPALPVRGEIDVVGAGDAVSANLITAIAAGASLGEAMQLAMTAASVVVHQLGTTGTATPGDLARHLPFPDPVAIR